jgi:hypothetical protein
VLAALKITPPCVQIPWPACHAHCLRPAALTLRPRRSAQCSRQAGLASFTPAPHSAGLISFARAEYRKPGNRRPGRADGHQAGRLSWVAVRWGSISLVFHALFLHYAKRLSAPRSLAPQAHPRGRGGQSVVPSEDHSHAPHPACGPLVEGRESEEQSASAKKKHENQKYKENPRGAPELDQSAHCT